MWPWLIGFWLIGDGVFSLIAHLPDKRQTWTEDHSVRILRIVMGAVLMWVNRGQFKRLRSGLSREDRHEG